MSGRGRATVGVVGRPHGLRGDVHVRPDPDIADEFPPGGRYRADDGRELEVVQSRVHAGRRVVRFGGVEDRDGAEALRGLVLTVARADVRLDEDAVWSDDVVGREAVDDGGRHIGVVGGVADGPAHDYLVIERPAHPPAFVPAVEELVSLERERVVVHAIPGLLDPQEAT